MLKVGLTGGIACGKSKAASFFQKRGWHVIETDTLAHRQYDPSTEGYKKVIDCFGPTILNGDGSVNRTALGRIVFGEAEKLKLLNSIIHPLVRAAWQSELRNLAHNTPDTFALVIIPLLYETGCESYFDHVMCVACSKSAQLQRLKSRGLSEEECVKRIQAQWPLAQKIAACDILLWNDGSVELLENQILRLLKRWAQE